MKNKFLLALGVTVFATAAHARDHLTVDPNQIALYVHQVTPVSGGSTVSTQVGDIKFSGTNYGILAPTASSSNAGAHVGTMSPFNSSNVLMTSSQAPQSEQDEVAQLQSEANQAASDGNGNIYDDSQCWTGGDHSHYIEGCVPNVCTPTTICTQWGFLGCLTTQQSSCNAPFENPFAGEVWWACNGVNLPPTLTQLTSQVIPYFLQPTAYAGIQASMASFMNRENIVSGVFHLDQTVQYADNLQEAVYRTGTDAYGYPTYGCNTSLIKMDNAQVSFSFYLDQNGKIMTSPATVNAENTNILYIKYFPRAMQPNVPAAYNYANAGYLTYQAMDMNMTPQGLATSVNVNGAYDAADNSQPAILTQVNCIVNHSNAGCNQSAPDARTLSALTGGNNSVTVIDYAHQMDADYIPISATTNQSILNFALSLTSNTLTYPPCGYAVFENKGSYTEVLDSQTDRFIASSNGQVQEVNSVTGQQQTSPTAYDWTQAQDPVSGVTADSTSILDPIANSSLIPVSELPSSSVVQLAPLTVIGSPPPSSYYALGNTVCDVTNHRTLYPECGQGFSASLDANGNPVCTGTCTDANNKPYTCTVGGTFNAVAW